jgi:hypothetical protein
MISIFHETKIPAVDVKVHLYFNFFKKNFKKKLFSDLHEEWNI